MALGSCAAALLVLAWAAPGLRSEDGKDGPEWQALFNGKDTTGQSRLLAGAVMP